MQQIVLGDQAAFSELYLRYKSRMYYYFYRMLGNSTDTANDFLQELFMKLIEKPESYNPTYSFSTWFYSVANNMCKNEYRKRGIRQEYQEAEALEPQIDYLPDTTIEHEQVVEKIFTTLDTLAKNIVRLFCCDTAKDFRLKK